MHALPGRRYYNLYGPTETNVCTYRRIESIDEIGDDDVPIGKACDTTAVAAFDEHLREVSVGETGELHVSGPGVAVGYFNNDEKTREAFIRIPAGPRGNRLWYATGDIVRRISAEEYRYVGRKDLMVKCAGFRVELQEIERVLLMHPVIREAAVVPRYREERGSVSLHAFVSFKPGARATISDLKRCCDKSLPRYMIPEHVDILDELPKNPNGKIDRNLLLTAGAPNKGN
jgi:acyl-coenzyme A synthetase/AMP-(fatty) acid ligase